MELWRWGTREDGKKSYWLFLPLGKKPVSVIRCIFLTQRVLEPKTPQRGETGTALNCQLS